jgi:hypothetical protein
MDFTCCGDVCFCLRSLNFPVNVIHILYTPVQYEERIMNIISSCIFNIYFLISYILYLQ